MEPVTLQNSSTRPTRLKFTSVLEEKVLTCIAVSYTHLDVYKRQVWSVRGRDGFRNSQCSLIRAVDMTMMMMITKLSQQKTETIICQTHVANICIYRTVFNRKSHNLNGNCKRALDALPGRRASETD